MRHIRPTVISTPERGLAWVIQIAKFASQSHCGLVVVDGRGTVGTGAGRRRSSRRPGVFVERTQVALPLLSAEQRAAALRRAAEARRVRADAREELRRAGSNLPVVIAGIITRAETDEALGKMRVAALIESVPGIGKVRAAATMQRLRISPSRRVRGLGAHQRAALTREFTAADVE